MPELAGGPDTQNIIGKSGGAAQSCWSAPFLRLEPAAAGPTGGAQPQIAALSSFPGYTRIGTCRPIRTVMGTSSVHLDAEAVQS